MAEIFWIDGNPVPGLAIVSCPRGEAWLKDEMLQLKRDGIDTLVSLLEPREAEWFGLGREAEAARNAGLEFLSYPIPDASVPADRADFRAFIDDLAQRVRRGQRIGAHCRGCIGRAPITAACTLIHLGWKPKTALAAIAKARGYPIPYTEEQRAWILAHEARS